MNRLIIAVAIIIPLAAVFFVVNTSKQKRDKAALEARALAAEQNAESESEAEVEKEYAIEITGENFDALVMQSDQIVVLDFWAPWCAPCMMLGPHVEKIAADYEGKVVLGKVNTDEQKELAVKHKAASIPLVLVFKGGEVVGQVAGFEPATTPDEIRKIVDGALAK